MAAHFFRVNERVLRYSHTIGQRGYVGPGFYQPTDLAIGKYGLDPAQPKGAIYVVNCSAPEVSEGP